jgi:hypothetical protein
VLLSHENWRRQLVGMFPKDSAEHAYSWLDSTTPAALSNDGQWLSFREAGEAYYIGNDSQAYCRKTDGSPAVSLGDGQGTISPDGKWILTFSRKSKMVLQPVGIGEPKQIPAPGLTNFDHASWSDDGRTIAYEGLTAQSEWNVYTQKIDGSPPTLVRHQGRNAAPTLSSDGSVIALREEHGGISLYRADGSQPEAVKGVLPSEYSDSIHQWRSHIASRRRKRKGYCPDPDRSRYRAPPDVEALADSASSKRKRRRRNSRPEVLRLRSSPLLVQSLSGRKSALMPARPPDALRNQGADNSCLGPLLPAPYRSGFRHCACSRANLACRIHELPTADLHTSLLKWKSRSNVAASELYYFTPKHCNSLNPQLRTRYTGCKNRIQECVQK